MAEPFQIYLVITANNDMYRANSANLIRKIKMLIKKHEHDRRGSHMKVTEMLAGSLMNYRF